MLHPGGLPVNGVLWYDRHMTTPALRDAPPPTVQGRVVTPSATASGAQSAVFGLAQVLKELIHGTPQAFTNENQVLGALTSVDKWVKAHVPGSALSAVRDGTERAEIEDVSKRPAPNGVSYSIPTTAPTIDYDKLAEAMVRAQMRIAAEHAPENPSVTSAPPATEQQESEQYG